MSPYGPSSSAGALRQGEILSEVIQAHISIDYLRSITEEPEIEEKFHPQAIVLSQDCDLYWDFTARNELEGQRRLEHKIMPNVLFGELIPEEDLRGKLRESRMGSDIWRRVVRNMDERYHYLPQIRPEEDRAGQGLSALVVDFKRVFAILTEELYIRLQGGTRWRTCIQGPFLQHLSSRFGYYCLRVALPEPKQNTAISSPGAALPEPAQREPK